MEFAGQKQKPLEEDAGERTIAWLDKLRNSNGSLPTSKIRLNMQRVMQTNAAVFRTQETLEEGKSSSLKRKSFLIFCVSWLISPSNSDFCIVFKEIISAR